MTVSSIAAELQVSQLQVQRLMEWINRSVGQHHRYTREDFAAARIRLLGEP